MLFAAAAEAAPPASCARKFVGTWVHATGTTLVKPDGTAIPSCPFCVSVQYWTCNGDQYLFSNSGPPGQFSTTLVAPDVMQGAGGVARRIGAAPASPPAAAPANPRAEQPSGDARSCLNPPRRKGSQYSITSKCPGQVVAVVRTRDESNRCAQEIMAISRTVSGDGFSYFNTPPTVVFACHAGGPCTSAALRARYGSGCQ
jgi:hypothetical protein